MKKIRKIFAVLLSLAMVLGMSMTTFAAADEVTDATIRVSTSGTDDTMPTTLKYAQVVKANQSSEDGWAILEAYQQAFSDAGLTVKDLADIAKGETPINKNAATGTINGSKELGAVLEAISTDSNTIFTLFDNISAGTTNITSAGLYLIVAEQNDYEYTPMLVYVPVDTSDTIDVVAKGEPTQINKDVEDEGQSVREGDVVQYTVKVRYPSFAPNFENPVFSVNDTLTNALFTIDADHPLSIMYGDTDAAEDTYTVNKANGTDTLEIEFNYDIANAHKLVTITYWATVGKGIAGEKGQLKNDVTSKIGTEEDFTQTETEVISNPVKATIKKVDADNKEKVLSGAEFALYEGLAKDYDEETSTPVTKGTIGDDGTFTFTGLDAQKDYYIVETKAPAGYAVDKTPVQLKGAEADKDNPHMTVIPAEQNNGVKKIVKEYKFSDFGDQGVTTVVNTTLSSLPSTGGIGTTIFTIGGCLIMIVAAGLFFASRRKSAK